MKFLERVFSFFRNLTGKASKPEKTPWPEEPLDYSDLAVEQEHLRKQNEQASEPPADFYVDPSDFPELSMDNYQAGPNDNFINITLIWDLDAYSTELAQIVSAEPALRGVMEMAHQMSESQTTYMNCELMPTEARLIKTSTPETLIAKRGKSPSMADSLVEDLERSLPPLLEGGRPEAYEFWWLAENGDREVRRYTPSAE